MYLYASMKIAMSFPCQPTRTSNQPDSNSQRNTNLKNVMPKIQATKKATMMGLRQRPRRSAVEKVSIGGKSRSVSFPTKLSENKRKVIEDAYFRAKAVFDSHEIQFLTAPVEDFNSFYLDEGNETIMVWNKEKADYTNIFNLPEDLAYRIALKILDNDFISE